MCFLCATVPGDRVFEDANGVKYPGNLLCVTNDCIQNTITFYTSETVTTSAGGHIPELKGLMVSL